MLLPPYAYSTVNVRRTIGNPSYVNVLNKRKHTSNVSNPKDDMIQTKFHLPNLIQNDGYPKANDHTIVVDVVVVVVDDTITNPMLVLKVEVRGLEWKRMRPNWMLLLVLLPRLVEEEMVVVVNQVLLTLRFHPVVLRGRVRVGRGVRL